MGLTPGSWLGCLQPQLGQGPLSNSLPLLHFFLGRSWQPWFPRSGWSGRSQGEWGNRAGVHTSLVKWLSADPLPPLS